MGATPRFPPHLNYLFVGISSVCVCMLMLGRAVSPISLALQPNLFYDPVASGCSFFFPVLKCNTWILGKGKNLLSLVHKTRKCILPHHGCHNHSCTAEPDALAGLCPFFYCCSSSRVSRHQSQSGDCRVSPEVDRGTLGKWAAATCRALEMRAGMIPGEYGTKGCSRQSEETPPWKYT